MTITIIRPGQKIYHLPGYGINITEGGVAPASAGNGLLTGLVAYWPGDEANGNLLDAHTNHLDLTDVNTVTSAEGKVYSTARQYTRANTEYHSRNAESLLNLGDIAFTVAAWAYWDGGYGYHGIIAKDGGNVPNRELILMRTPAGKLAANVWIAAGERSCVANSFGNVPTSTWFFVVAWHDPGANTVYIQVNNGNTDSLDLGASLSGPSRAPFCVGNGSGIPWNGRIGPTAFWKAVLTAGQRTALYNGGNGLAYSGFTA